MKKRFLRRWRRQINAMAMMAAMSALSAGNLRAEPPALPPQAPILLIETGGHVSQINRLAVDKSCQLFVTASNDKTTRLWSAPARDGEPPVLIRTFRTPIGPDKDGKIYSTAMTPDGKLVAVGGWYKGENNHWVYLFETATGRVLHFTGGIHFALKHLAFSHDGRFLAGVSGGGDGMMVWETASWRLAGKDAQFGGGDSYAIEFDKFGRLYAAAFDGYIRRYRLDPASQTFRLDARAPTAGGKNPISIAVHPSGDRLAVGFHDSRAIEVYGTNDLKRMFAADTSDISGGEVNSVGWSADGARLFGGGSYPGTGDSKIRVWGDGGKGKPRDSEVSKNTITHVVPCGQGAAVAAQDPAFGAVTATGARRFWQEGVAPDARNKTGDRFTVSADGGKIRFGLGYGGKEPVLFDVAAGSLRDAPVAPSGLFAPDVKALKVGDWENSTTPQYGGRPLAFIDLETSRSLAVAPKGEAFVLGTDFMLRAYARSGAELWRQPGHGVAWGVNIPRGGRFVTVAYNDGTIRWHRLDDGAEVLALFVNARDREWVMWTPQGYYASSPGGDRYIGWHVNRGWKEGARYFTAAQLKRQFYRPDIVKRAFALASAEKAVGEAGLGSFRLEDLSRRQPPDFIIASPESGGEVTASMATLTLQIGQNPEPVTNIEALVNGRRAAGGDTRGLARTEGGAQTPSLEVPLERGENRITVKAANAIGETARDIVLHRRGPEDLEKKGRLIIVAVGVDKYVKLPPENTLRFAAADAHALVETMTSKAGPLYSQVKTVLLATGEKTTPTRAGVEDALTLFGEAGPEDTVVLFLAGHGVNDGADYFFLPEDAEAAGGKWRPSSVVKWQVLQEALQGARGRRLMFVDTCHAGGAFNSRLIKDAADANIVVFSATDTDTLAQERPELGHGVFTYAIIQGLAGKADVYKNGAVSILSLGSFVSNEVKKLTQNAQQPTFHLAGSKDFVVASP